MMKQLWQDEAGVIISAELVLVLSIVVLAMVVGLHAVAKAVVFELGDLASAFGSFNQSFAVGGFVHDGHSFVGGGGFTDAEDDCDCVAIIQVQQDAHVQGETGTGPESETLTVDAAP